MGNEQVKGASKSKLKRTLTKRDYSIVSKQTGLTHSEIVVLFDKFHANNQDGKLDRIEFGKLYVSLRKEPVRNLNQVVDFVFNAFDKDHSGYLSFHEFIIAYALTTKGDPEVKLGYAFDVYDADQSGYLTADEVRAGLAAMLKLLGADKDKYDMDKLVNDCCKILDANGDGKITKPEFINGLMQNYSLRVLMSPFN